MLQFLINGLITGVLYSLLAIGFALVYNTTRIFHIAAAALYVVAAYAFYVFVVKLGLPLVLAFVLATIFTMLISLCTEYGVYQPLKQRKASLNVTMIASIGLMTVLVNLVAMIFGNETKVIDNTIQPTFAFGDIIITTPQMCQLVVGVAIIVIFLLFISFSRFGLKLRALSTDDELYATMGYSINRTRTYVFLLSGLDFGLSGNVLSVDNFVYQTDKGLVTALNGAVSSDEFLYRNSRTFGQCRSPHQRG